MDGQTKKYIAISGICIAAVALAGFAALPLVSNPMEKRAIAAEAQKFEGDISQPSNNQNLSAAYTSNVSTTPLTETAAPIEQTPSVPETAPSDPGMFEGLGESELVVTEEVVPEIIEQTPEPEPQPAIIEAPISEPIPEPVPVTVEPAPAEVQQPVVPQPIIEQPVVQEPVVVPEQPVVVEQPVQTIPEPVIEYIDGVPSRDIERAIIKTPAGYHYQRSFYDPVTQKVQNHYISDTGVLKIVTVTSLSTLKTYNTYVIE